MKKISNTSERLKYFMSHTGLTQTDILDRCVPYETDQVKISRPYLSQYVTGKFEPNQERLEILARAMNVDEVWLMGYDVPMRAGDKDLDEEDVDQFRQRMRDQYGVLFDMYDGASPEDRKKIEEMVKIITRHDDNIDGA